MSVYCISYDLGENGDQNYEAVIERIRSFGPACELTASTWLVSTTLDSSQILRLFDGITCSYDKLAVFEVATSRADWSITAGKDVDTEDTAVWMQKYL